MFSAMYACQFLLKALDKAIPFETVIPILPEGLVFTQISTKDASIDEWMQTLPTNTETEENREEDVETV